MKRNGALRLLHLALEESPLPLLGGHLAKAFACKKKVVALATTFALMVDSATIIWTS